MNRIFFGVGLALLFVVVAIAFGSATWLFWEVWRGSDRDVFKGMLSAFSGAFFAFIFVRIGDGLRRLFERQEKNHSALVRTEHYLNNCLGSIGDNLGVVDDFLGLVSRERLDRGDTPVFINRLRTSRLIAAYCSTFLILTM